MRALGFMLAFLVQVGLLGWAVAERALIFAYGGEIQLPVVPIDPRDLVRGDFVALSYGISRVESDEATADEGLGIGATVFVTIAPDPEAGWRPTAIGRAMPVEGTFLRGTVQRIAARLPAACSGDALCFTYTVAYNLEQHFVPEGAGSELEALRDDQRMAADIAVTDDGRAAIKRLLVDGEVRYEEGWW